MVAALLRVLHSGIQDSRLLSPKGQPNVGLFTTVLVKAGRFTTQWVRLDFDTKPNFGTKAVITLPRKGHLISRLFLVCSYPDIFTTQRAAAETGGAAFLGPTWTWTNSLGHALINTATHPGCALRPTGRHSFPWFHHEGKWCRDHGRHVRHRSRRAGGPLAPKCAVAACRGQRDQVEW